LGTKNLLTLAQRRYTFIAAIHIGQFADCKIFVRPPAVFPHHSSESTLSNDAPGVFLNSPGSKRQALRLSILRPVSLPIRQTAGSERAKVREDF
jgi:hypothetical protein